MSVAVKGASNELLLAAKTFIMRGADRDAKLDRTRAERLVEAVDTVIQEIIAERNGLVARVQKTVTQSVDVSKKKLARRDFPTTKPAVELRNAEKRLIRLAKQIHELNTARATFSQWTQPDASKSAAG